MWEEHKELLSWHSRLPASCVKKLQVVDLLLGWYIEILFNVQPLILPPSIIELILLHIDHTLPKEFLVLAHLSDNTLAEVGETWTISD